MNYLITSDDLKLIQKILDDKIKNETDKPDTDYEMLSSLSLVLAKVDKNRRNIWSQEHFGAYEEMVDDIIDNSDIVSNDIPF